MQPTFSIPSNYRPNYGTSDHSNTYIFLNYLRTIGSLSHARYTPPPPTPFHIVFFATCIFTFNVNEVPMHVTLSLQPTKQFYPSSPFVNPLLSFILLHYYALSTLHLVALLFYTPSHSPCPNQSKSATPSTA